MSYKSSEHIAWTNMKQRCLNPKNRSYHNYGARGIQVCERWLHSFKSFLADMGYKPGPEYTLDRKNNDGDYKPSNCRWTTRSIQRNNTRIQQRKRIKLMWGATHGPDLFA